MEPDLVSPIPSDSQDATRGLIRQAARETGADFDFLVNTAARESNFDTQAQARTSSAAGLFQFIEQTWLGMIHRHGEAHGYGELAGQIERGADGRFSVSDPEKRQQIMDLRFDAAASARMAGELASDNASVIESRIGRQPSSGELYAAHFLGAQGAAGLIAAVDRSPSLRADQLFPAAAAANRPIFYDGNRPRSVSDVLAVLTREPAAGHSAAPARGLQESAATGAATGAGAGGSAGFSAGHAPYTGPVSPGVHRVGHGELSPTLVEILASLDAPKSARVRET